MSPMLTAFFTIVFCTFFSAFLINVIAGTPMPPKYGSGLGAILGTAAGIALAVVTLPESTGTPGIAAMAGAATITAALACFAGIHSEYGRTGEAILGAVGTLACAGVTLLFSGLLALLYIEPERFEPAMILGVIVIGGMGPVTAAFLGMLLGAGPRLVLSSIFTAVINARAEGAAR